MARDHLYVHPAKSKWEISSDEAQGDSDMAPFDTKEDAVAAAILSAENSHEKGRVAQVLVKDDADSDYRIERIFGSD